MKTLTERQHQILNYVSIIQAKTAKDILTHYPDAIPTQWVFATKLTVFKVTLRELRAIANKGYLEMASSDGFGEQVRRINSSK